MRVMCRNAAARERETVVRVYNFSYCAERLEMPNIYFTGQFSRDLYDGNTHLDNSGTGLGHLYGEIIYSCTQQYKLWPT